MYRDLLKSLEMNKFELRSKCQVRRVRIIKLIWIASRDKKDVSINSRPWKVSTSYEWLISHTFLLCWTLVMLSVKMCYCTEYSRGRQFHWPLVTSYPGLRTKLAANQVGTWLINRRKSQCIDLLVTCQARCLAWSKLDQLTAVSILGSSENAVQAKLDREAPVDNMQFY